MISAAITVFGHIMNNQSHRHVIVKVASKNQVVVKINSQGCVLYEVRTDSLCAICYK